MTDEQWQGLEAIATGVGAVLLIFLVLQDAFEVMLLPRRVQRRMRFAVVYFRGLWKAASLTAAGLLPERGRAGFLSHFGALSMLGLFGSWAAALIVGFGVLEWTLQPAAAGKHSASPLVEQVYMSGVTFFTLGYGDVVPHSGVARLATVLEAGIGLGFIAVVIGYLPLIHQLFSRREALIIQLDSRAGSPPTAVALLCRHADAGGLPELNDFLRDWEVWAAELLEGHLSYPMLVFYRSQHDNQSWLAAIAAVTDCCALLMVGAKGLSPFQARMTFEMMRQVVVELTRSFKLAPSASEGGDRLPAEAAARLDAALARSGLQWDASEDAIAALQALRATYEPLLDGLSRFLMLSLPGWLPERDAEDHWERGHRGVLARHLVEQVAARPGEPSD